MHSFIPHNLFYPSMLLKHICSLHICYWIHVTNIDAKTNLDWPNSSADLSKIWPFCYSRKNRCLFYFKLFLAFTELNVILKSCEINLVDTWPFLYSISFVVYTEFINIAFVHPMLCRDWKTKPYLWQNVSRGFSTVYSPVAFSHGLLKYTGTMSSYPLVVYQLFYHCFHQSITLYDYKSFRVLVLPLHVFY